MSRPVRDVYIVGGSRTPFVKSMTKYAEVSRQDLMVHALTSLNEKFHLSERPLGDVALGALLNSSSNWNLARESVLGAGLHPFTPAYNVQRACGTSLETTLQIALKIANHQIEDGVAGGVDTNSDLPVELSLSLRDKLLELNRQKTLSAKLQTLAHLRLEDFKPKYPDVIEVRTGLSMGQHAELMVKEWQISREAQDELAFRSHQHGAAAYESGFYDDLVAPFMGLTRDGILRADTSLAKLAKLPPAYDRQHGTLTAGNSTPLTDGAAAVLLASEESMKIHGWTPLAKFVDAQVAAIDFVGGDGLLMAPTVAVAKLLERNNLSLQDFDFYEIHEAFAAQVLCTLKAWESPAYCQKYLNRSSPLGSIDQSKMNLVGGSLALGHPFAATGARIVAALAKQLSEKKKGRGLISVCTAGGMGVAAIVEAI